MSVCTARSFSKTRAGRDPRLFFSLARSPPRTCCRLGPGLPLRAHFSWASDLCGLRPSREWLDQHRGSRSQRCDQPHQMAALQRDASGGRRISGTRHVHEDRAAPALHAWPCIVIEHDHKIIQMVVTPHMLGARRIGMRDMTIVVSVADSIAPSVVAADRRQRNGSLRTSQSIAAIVSPNHDELTDRRCPIPLALQRDTTGSSQCARQAQSAHCQPSLARPHRKGGHAQSPGDHRRFCGLLAAPDGPGPRHCFDYLSGDRLRLSFSHSGA